MGLDVSSHLHPVGSFDLADHPVPNGREEVWRFTPLKRLRGLHDEAPLTGHDFDVKVEAPQGVLVTRGERSNLGRTPSGLVPTDRISARVWGSAPSSSALTYRPTPRWPSRSSSPLPATVAPTRSRATCW